MFDRLKGSKSGQISAIFSILILAFCYSFLGYISLRLAISPGYATAIFPSAGIALAALLIWGKQLWPGVFLGSALLNISIDLEQSDFSLAGVGVAFSIATGATLQTVSGRWLIHRHIRQPITLAEEWEIIRFMLLAGPIACAINASIGVASLYFAQIITLSEVLFSWFTWWVGDSIGVLIAIPLMFIAFAKPRQLWKGRIRVVTLPLLAMLTANIVLFTYVNRLESERIQFDFKEISVYTHENLLASFASYLDSVASIERFYSSSVDVSREEFHTFVANDLIKKPGINGLSWNPIITNEQRVNFEKTVIADGFSEFKITERSNKGQLVAASPRDDYIVVNYIEPYEVNKKAMGFDVASNPTRKKALNEARDTASPIVTGRITLVQESGEQAGILLFHPIFSGPHETTEERRRNLKGYAVGVFRVGDIVDTVLASQYRDKLIVGIYDESSTLDKSLYGPADPSKYTDALFSFNEIIEIGGRKWSVYFWPSPGYLVSHSAWQAWAVIFAGLLFTCISAVFLLAMTGRSYYLDREVKARTKDLEANQNKLIQINKTLESSNIQLERTNEELDQYAFVASHDLKSPLQAIKQLSGWIEEDCKDILPENTRRHLTTLKERTHRMEKLLSDLLMFSRISRDEYEIENVDLQKVVEKAFIFNAVPDCYTLETRQCDTVIALPRIPLELTLRNLISNAVKHHDKPYGAIIVEYSRQPDMHIVRVTDDGPGIPPNLKDKAIEMFQTLKSRDEVEGSGLGLSVVKKAVERFNGMMKIMSDGVRGTTIELSWPKMTVTKD